MEAVIFSIITFNWSALSDSFSLIKASLAKLRQAISSAEN